MSARIPAVIIQNWHVVPDDRSRGLGTYGLTNMVKQMGRSKGIGAFHDSFDEERHSESFWLELVPRYRNPWRFACWSGTVSIGNVQHPAQIEIILIFRGRLIPGFSCNLTARSKTRLPVRIAARHSSCAHVFQGPWLRYGGRVNACCRTEFRPLAPALLYLA